jgi:hypothetical protein
VGRVRIHRDVRDSGFVAWRFRPRSVRGADRRGNIAARLESRAAAGTVLISQSTYDLIPGRIVATELEPIMVKGKSEPIHIFRAEDVA